MSRTTHTIRPALLRRVLDGGHSWGSLDVSPPRYGVSRHRLVVFPPGISADDRVLLRAWRTWPIWGVAVFLVLQIVLIQLFSSGAALTFSAGIALGAGGVIMAMTGAHRSQVRTMSVVRTACADDLLVAERFAELQSLVETLATADHALAEGTIDAVEHELAVWYVYERMADGGTHPLA
jgi:hypothetical protein